MKYLLISITITGLILIGTSCQKDEIFPANHYYSTLSFPDSSDQHPKHDQYREIIDNYMADGGLGVSVMIADREGTWLGAGGYADIASGVKMQTGNQFLIASISKVFTAACIFSYVDRGMLSIEDPLSKWLDASVLEGIDNADEARISHLLSHTSGIVDYYTIKFTMNQYNRADNDWTQEKVLDYVRGKKAWFPVGKYYAYSNTNYLLLGLILEKVSGKSLKEIYTETLFEPLHLESAWYGTGEASVPDGVVKGYRDLYGNNNYIESDGFYMDELGIGGDGGIAINAQDLGTFMIELMAGDVVSETSLAAMQNWFELPFHWNPDTLITNGYGLEYFENDQGIAYGHTGGIDGFSSLLNYYPEREITIVLLFNFVVGTEESWNKMEDFGKALEAAAFE